VQKIVPVQGSDLEHILSCHWPHLFASVDPTTPITLSKVSTRNWLISSSGGLSYILKSASSSSINSLDFELQYLIDLNRFLANEYRVPVPIPTVTGQYHANGRYWLYEYIDGKVRLIMIQHIYLTKKNLFH
jgi:hypothetical protein